jgi:hypothetical protein
VINIALARVYVHRLFRACIVSLSTAGLAPSLCQKKEQALGWLLLTCGRAPSNMCSLVYKIYIIVQNIALDRVVWYARALSLIQRQL